MNSRLLNAVAAVVACAMAATVFALSAQEPIPAIPLLYSGRVYVEGRPAPDGLQILARIVDYETEPVEVEDGWYMVLQVAPPGTGYANRTITFHATFGADEVEALETAIYRPPDLTKPGSITPTQDLHFDRLPMPPPTPTPTATPTITPTPTAALPIPGDPTVGAASVWVLVVGAVGLMVGLAVLRLARRRRS